jgi:Lin1244/Lin1753-like, N-terminal
MGRPIKNGLDYFPLDIDFFQDEKIRHVSAAFGVEGEMVAIKLLCKIYRQGYFIKWDLAEAKLFAQEIKIPAEKLQKIIQELLKRNFFDKNLKKNEKILSSAGIQKRFIKFCSLTKRFPEIDTKYMVYSEENGINSEFTKGRVNSEFSTQRKERKERKEIKESDPEKNNSKISIKTPNYDDEISAAVKRLARDFG